MPYNLYLLGGSTVITYGPEGKECLSNLISISTSRAHNLRELGTCCEELPQSESHVCPAASAELVFFVFTPTSVLCIAEACNLSVCINT